MAFIEGKNLTKIYGSKETEIHALDGVSFNIEKGEFVVILGASGAGKSTMLNILGGMDRATSGMYKIEDAVVTDLNEKKLGKFRRTEIGFVFQFYNLIPSLSALENVALQESVCRNKDHMNSKDALEAVGLGERLNNFPSQLSGGEQQRVSIARAIVKKPKLLLCDEPTGALDYNTGKQILQLLQDTCRKEGITVVLITHNSAIAPMADRLIRFKSGKVIEETKNENPISVSEIEW